MKITKIFYTFLAFILLTLLLFTPAYIFHTNQKDEKKELYFESKISQARMQFEAVKTSYRLVSQNVFDNIINKPEIVSLIKEANKIDDPELSKILRKELYRKLQPLYQNLNTQNIYLLHFHLQGNRSFLRFHRPEKYGDSLVGIRYSIAKLNMTHEAVHGFEEGRLFNGFRHVFPLMHKKRLVGSVEISYSFNALKIEAKKIYPAYYSFLLKKEILEAKSFSAELENYTPAFLSKSYLQDKRSIDIETKDFDHNLIEDINTNIKQSASEKIKEGRDFLLDTKIGETHYIISFITIANVEGKQVAYYITYQKDLTLGQIEETYLTQLLFSSSVSFIFAILLVLYIRLQQKASKTLEILATTDPLTKIANRNKLNMVMDASIRTSQRYDLPLSVIFFDVDRFKEMNDKLGHDTGDEILVELSTLVTHAIRSSDLLARWGGEEFIIVLPETDQTQAHALAEKLRKRIDEHTFVVTVKMTCSFGVTQLHKDDDEASLLKRVDTALYSAKESGRNRVVELS